MYSTYTQFDESSAEWRRNKIRGQNGHFKYKCQKEGCREPIYLYTTEHKHFHLFADEFDLLHKTNERRYFFCQEHL